MKEDSLSNVSLVCEECSTLKETVDMLRAAVTFYIICSDAKSFFPLG